MGLDVFGSGLQRRDSRYREGFEFFASPGPEEENSAGRMVTFDWHDADQTFLCMGLLCHLQILEVAGSASIEPSLAYPGLLQGMNCMACNSITAANSVPNTRC